MGGVEMGQKVGMTGPGLKLTSQPYQPFDSYFIICTLTIRKRHDTAVCV